MMKWVVMSIVGASVLLGSSFVSAAQSVQERCQYHAEPGVNPSFQTMNCLLTETALDFDVPPEVVKAVAEGESGDWRHFDENGQAIVTEDNGIGVMQLTNQSIYNEQMLKTNLVYNIWAGVELLSEMFNRNDLPKINDNERDIIENWYFAVMAYNGIKPVNSPILQETGERNVDAYQEKVFRVMNTYGLLDLAELSFSTEDFHYDRNSSDNIEFVTEHYEFEGLTKSKHHFKAGQVVAATTDDVRVRQRATSDSSIVARIAKGEAVTIDERFMYEENESRKNHFVWYRVKTKDGVTGYVASSYLEPSEASPSRSFSDVPSGHWAEEQIHYLVDQEIIAGYANGKFGTNDPLTRWQAALILVRANGASLTNRPNPGFDDVPTSHPYYQAIAAAVDEGLFSGVSKTMFKPGATLTRREMAVLLQRLYKFPAPTSTHPFTDVPKGAWYEDAVHRVYGAGVAAGMTKTTFAPVQEVTRGQFAVFMARAMDESFRLR